jgi:hypothetical protein
VKDDMNFPGLRVHLANIARFMRTLLHEFRHSSGARAMPCG